MATYSLGKGYKSAFKECAPNFSIPEVKQQIDSTEQHIYNMQMRCVSELHEVDSAIDAGLSAGIANKIPLATLKAEFKLNAQSKHTQHTQYAIIIIDQPTKTDTLSNPTLDEVADSYLKEGDAESFYNQFGDTYVSRIDYKKQLIAILQFESTVAQNKKKVQQKLNASLKSAGVEESVSILKEKLNLKEITNKEIYCLGGDGKPWRFNNLEDLFKEIQSHMTSENCAIIDCDKESYSTIYGLSKEKLSTIRKVEAYSKHYLKDFLLEIEETKNKLQEIVSPNNINILNTYQDKTSNPLYKLFFNLQEQAGEHIKNLVGDAPTKGLSITNNEQYQKLRNMLDKAKSWYEKNKLDIINSENYTLIDKVNISPQDKSATDFTVTIPEPLRSQTNALLFQADHKQNITLDIFSKKYRIGFFHNPSPNGNNEMSGEGTLVPKEFANAAKVRVKTVGNLNEATTLNIYAQSKAIKDEPSSYKGLQFPRPQPHHSYNLIDKIGMFFKPKSNRLTNDILITPCPSAIKAR